MVKTASQPCPPPFFHRFAPSSNEVSTREHALVRRFIPSFADAFISRLDAVTRLRAANFSISRRKFTTVIVDDLPCAQNTPILSSYEDLITVSRIYGHLSKHHSAHPSKTFLINLPPAPSIKRSTDFTYIYQNGIIRRTFKR